MHPLPFSLFYSLSLRQKVRFTVLNPIIGLDPATVDATDLSSIRVTPATSARFYNKPAD